MTARVWDFWAKRYSSLWVQKYSLRPTRACILELIEEDMKDKKSKASKLKVCEIKENSRGDDLFKGDRGNIKLLDIGCGPGELISVIENTYDEFQITGLDFSQEMINISKAKNPNISHIKLDAKDLDKLRGRFHMILCTHSLPYYKELDKFFLDLYEILEDHGRAYIAFASGDSFYDRLALSFVKLTTGPAYYPSDNDFRSLISGYFKIESLNIIRERFFMPRIAVYKLSKVKL